MMRKIISSLLILTFCLAFLAGCSLLPKEIAFRNVNFYVDGELYTTKSVIVGQSVSVPKNPEKENFVFTGWRTDGAVSYMYDFSYNVIDHMDLHACFTLDAVAVGNMIAEKTVKSTVQVFNTNSNTSGETVLDAYSSQGSGVVIKISGGYCYVITNAHVVEKEDNYANQSIVVRDPWGNLYEGHIYKDPSTNLEAVSRDFDLALIWFRYTPRINQELIKIKFGENAKVGDYVVAVGNPQGLINSVTYGNALAYQEIVADDDDSINKVTFDVLFYNAPTDHGSSGGAIVDPYGKLVGISFAGANNGEYGCAIPISKVKEFLNIYYKLFV
jgi:S1-C subfamily serine protease